MVKSEENIVINDTSKLTKDIASLYLNTKFSDITLIVQEEKIHAHKIILAARSTYFESLLYDAGQEITHQTELTLNVDTSIEAFKNVLKFLYTGTITINPSDIEPTLELISLAHQCSMTDLELAVVPKLKSSLNLENICAVLNTANLYDLIELKDACHAFMDQHPSEVLTNDSFNDLSQKSLIKLLERDTFFAPEIEIFKNVAKWCRKNNDVQGLVAKCVRLSCLSVVEIVADVWPSKFVDCQDLLQAIAEIVEVKEKSSTCRAKLVMDVNLATAEHKASVISGTKTASLLTGNRNVDVYAETTVGNKDGFTIKLGFPAFINHIRFMLYDKDTRFYRYYVEISTDQKKWKKVIDYSQYSCRSIQNLFFNKEVARYIRVVGTHNSANTAFHIIFFETYYKSSVPTIKNNIICPTSNVATVDKKATVFEGATPGALLDGVTTNYSSYTYHVIGQGSIIVELAQPYMLSSLKMLLWDNDTRHYKYYIETSTDKSSWTIVADHRNKDSKSWQVHRFSERPVVFIKITGTFNSANQHFHLIHFECPAGDDQKVYK